MANIKRVGLGWRRFIERSDNDLPCKRVEELRNARGNRECSTLKISPTG